MPTMRSGRVAVVFIAETERPEFDLPVSVEPVLADVPNDEFAKIAVSAVARLVIVASVAT